MSERRMPVWVLATASRQTRGVQKELWHPRYEAATGGMCLVNGGSPKNKGPPATRVGMRKYGR